MTLTMYDILITNNIKIVIIITYFKMDNFA